MRKSKSQKLLLIILISFLTTFSFAFEINCNYNKNEEWSHLSTLYTCLVTNDFPDMTPSNRSIASITGLHTDNLTNADVFAIYVSGRIMNYFPKNLKNHFENLQAIGFHNTGMKEIRKEDLKPFGEQLESIRVSGNDIEIIEHDLFKYNPNLKGIAMHRNKIKFIDGNSMRNLKFLNFLWLEDNDCIDKSANNPDSVKRVINEMRKKCFVNFMVLSNYEFLMTEKRELKQEIEYLKMKVNNKNVDGILRENSQKNRTDVTSNKNDSEIVAMAQNQVIHDDKIKFDHEKNENDQTQNSDVEKPKINNKEAKIIENSQSESKNLNSSKKVHRIPAEELHMNFNTQNTLKIDKEIQKPSKNSSDDLKKVQDSSQKEEDHVASSKKENMQHNEENNKKKLKTEDSKSQLNPKETNNEFALQNENKKNSNEVKSINHEENHAKAIEKDFYQPSSGDNLTKNHSKSELTNKLQKNGMTNEKIETDIKARNSIAKIKHENESLISNLKENHTNKSIEDTIETTTANNNKTHPADKNLSRNSENSNHKKDLIKNGSKKQENRSSKENEKLNVSFNNHKNEKSQNDSNENSKHHATEDSTENSLKPSLNSQEIVNQSQKVLADEKNNKNLVSSVQNERPKNESNIRDHSKIVTSPFSDDSEEISTVTVSIDGKNSRKLKTKEEKLVENENSSNPEYNKKTYKNDSMIEHIKSKVHSMMSFFSASKEVDIDKRKEQINEKHHINIDERKDHKIFNKSQDENKQKHHNENYEQQKHNNAGTSGKSAHKNENLSNSTEVKGKFFDSSEESQTNVPVVS